MMIAMDKMIAICIEVPTYMHLPIHNIPVLYSGNIFDFPLLSTRTIDMRNQPYRSTKEIEERKWKSHFKSTQSK